MNFFNVRCQFVIYMLKELRKRVKEKEKFLLYILILVLLLIRLYLVFYRHDQVSLCKLSLQITNWVFFKSKPLLTKQLNILWNNNHSWLLIEREVLRWIQDKVNSFRFLKNTTIFYQQVDFKLFHLRLFYLYNVVSLFMSKFFLLQR